MAGSVRSGAVKRPGRARAVVTRMHRKTTLRPRRICRSGSRRHHLVVRNYKISNYEPGLRCLAEEEIARIDEDWLVKVFEDCDCSAADVIVVWKSSFTIVRSENQGRCRAGRTGLIRPGSRKFGRRRSCPPNSSARCRSYTNRSCAPSSSNVELVAPAVHLIVGRAAGTAGPNPNRRPGTSRRTRHAGHRRPHLLADCCQSC